MQASVCAPRWALRAPAPAGRAPAPRRAPWSHSSTTRPLAQRSRRAPAHGCAPGRKVRLLRLFSAAIRPVCALLARHFRHLARNLRGFRTITTNPAHSYGRRSHGTRRTLRCRTGAKSSVAADHTRPQSVRGLPYDRRRRLDRSHHHNLGAHPPRTAGSVHCRMGSAGIPPARAGREGCPRSPSSH